MVAVVDEKVECFNPLFQSALDHVSFSGFNHAWNDVEGENAFRSRVISIDIKGNAHMQ
jgi:hypothetical protein